MILRPSVLCPIDFSEESRGALRYASAVAAHFGARLTLLAVEDPLLHEAVELAHVGPPTQDSARELELFFRSTFDHQSHSIPEVRTEVAIGKPASEILRVSHEKGCDFIVMSSRGASGFRKMFFGSTTERVLRETKVPVLVTPGADPGPDQLEEITPTVRRVLAPVDLTTATAHQLQIARGLAEALNLSLLLLHVLEPIRLSPFAHSRLPTVETERRYRAERQLDALLEEIPGKLKPEALIAYGEPAEEIAKVAGDRGAGLIVMGLHSSPLLGPRMGSVTYRVLCLAHRLVLAVPPLPVGSGGLALHAQHAAARRPAAEAV